jgi:hypothetical protein
MTVSNFEIADICKKHKIMLKLTDIITKDLLASVRCTKLKNLIINFAKSGQEGTHFVSLCIRGKEAYYQDSFGCYPLPEVVDYCKQHNLKLGYNSYIVQDIKSTNCGIYCVAMLKYVGVSGKLYDKANEFINLFEDDTKLNDNILRQYMNNVGITEFKYTST